MSVDHRAIAVGALAGAIATVVLLIVGIRWDYMIVVSAVVASPIAGALAAYASRLRMKPFREGGFAATAGFLFGPVVWMSAVALTSPGHPFDVLLVLFPFALLAMLMGFPFAFFVGGIVGERTIMRGH